MSSTPATDPGGGGGGGNNSSKGDGDDDTNWGLVVGLPVAIVLLLLIVGVVIFIIWKCKYRRKYSMNGGMTPEKQLTRHEDSMKKSTPPSRTASRNGSLKQRPEILLRTPSSEAELYVVRHVYNPKDSSHLRLQMGRIVEVVAKQDNGWWKGLVEDESGWFPSTYVKKIDASEKKVQKKREAPATPAHSPEKPVRVTFGGEQSGESPTLDVDGYTNVMLTVENETGDVNSNSKLPDIDKLDQNGLQGLINDIFTMEDEDSEQDVKPKVDFKHNEKIPPPLNTASDPTYAVVSKTSTPKMKTSNLKVKVDEPLPAESSMQVESPTSLRDAMKRRDRDTVISFTDQTPDSTVLSTESFEMKQSFGAESTFEVLDETSEVSLPHTVKSDSPASIGAVVGVTSSGAWKQTSDVTTIYDDYESEDHLPDLQNSYIDSNDHIINTHDVSASMMTPQSEKQPIPKEKLKLNLSTTMVEIDEEIDATAQVVKTQENRPRPKSETTKAVGVYVAMYTYTAAHEEQLSLAPNDVLLVPERKHVNGWVKGGKRDHPHKEGWFPLSYVREAADTHLLQVPSPTDKVLSEPELSDCEFGDHSFEEDLTGMAYRAKFPYTATQEGDVSFIEGDMLVVVETLDNGWWRGIVEGRSGWFPGSYVEVIPQTPMVNISAPSWPTSKKASKLEKSASQDSMRSDKEQVAVSIESLPQPLHQEEEVRVDDDGLRRASWSHSKPDLPKRFIIPKLMTVKGAGDMKQKSVDRPARPPPPAPPTGERKAPPRRRSSDKSNSLSRKTRKNSLPRPNIPPPRPPSETEDNRLSTNVSESNQVSPSASEDSKSLPSITDDVKVSSEGSLSHLPTSTSPPISGPNSPNESQNNSILDLEAEIKQDLQVELNTSPEVSFATTEEMSKDNEHNLQLHSTPMPKSTGRSLKLDIDAAQQRLSSERNALLEMTDSPDGSTKEADSSPIARDISYTILYDESPTKEYTTPKKGPSSPLDIDLNKRPTSPILKTSSSPPKSPDKVGIVKQVSFSSLPVEIVPDNILFPELESPESLKQAPERPPLPKSPKDKPERPPMPKNIEQNIEVSLNETSQSPEKPVISSKPSTPARPAAPPQKPKITSPKPESHLKGVRGASVSSTTPDKKTPPPRPPISLKKTKAPPIPTQKLNTSLVNDSKAINDSMIANKGDESMSSLASFDTSNIDYNMGTSVNIVDSKSDDLLSAIMTSFDDIRMNSEPSTPAQEPDSVNLSTNVDEEKEEVTQEEYTYDAKSPSIRTAISFERSKVDTDTEIVAKCDMDEHNETGTIEVPEPHYRQSNVVLKDDHEPEPEVIVRSQQVVSTHCPVNQELTSADLSQTEYADVSYTELNSSYTNNSTIHINDDHDSKPDFDLSVEIMNDSKPQNRTELDIAHSPKEQMDDESSLPTRVKVKRYKIEKPAVISMAEDEDVPSPTKSSSSVTSPEHSAVEMAKSMRQEQRARFSVSSEGEVFFTGSPPKSPVQHYESESPRHSPVLLREDDYNSMTLEHSIENESLHSNMHAQDNTTDIISDDMTTGLHVQKSTLEFTMVPSIEITSTPLPQKMSRGLEPSLNPTPIQNTNTDLDGSFNNEMESLHVGQIDADRLSLTDLLPDANIRPDTPQSGVSMDEPPPPLPSMPPPLEPPPTKPMTLSPNLSERSVEINHDSYRSEVHTSALTIDSAREAYISGVNNELLSPQSFTSASSAYEVNEDTSEVDDRHYQVRLGNGETVTVKEVLHGDSMSSDITNRTPLTNKHLLAHNSPNEVMATSPYIVIRTPNTETSESREVSSYDRASYETDSQAKVVENEAPDSKPVGLAGGLSMHLTSLFDKIFKSDDQLNAPPENENEHPLSKITFRKATPDVSTIETGDEMNSTSVNHHHVMKSQVSSTQSLTSEERPTPQKPPRRSRSNKSSSDTSSSGTLSPVQSYDIHDSTEAKYGDGNAQYTLPPLNPSPWSKQTIDAIHFQENQKINGTNENGSSSVEHELIVDTNVGDSSSTRDSLNSMRFFSPSAYKSTHYTSALTDSETHIDVTHTSENGHDVTTYHTVTHHVDAMAPSENGTSAHHLKDFDSPKPFRSLFSNLARQPSYDGKSDGRVVTVLSDHDEDVVEM